LNASNKIAKVLNFTEGALQIYGTTEFFEENYGGKDSRLWARFVIPLGKPPAPPRLIAY
jgi:hypothetical protein